MHRDDVGESARNQDGIGARVRVWTGKFGVAAYRTSDGWIGVKLDGEGGRIDEWQAWQVERLQSNASQVSIPGAP
jgi:hypothetical protein